MPPGGNVQLKNVAAVSVHAELPPFAKPGQTIDITISSIGNAKSLRGGSLLMTPLKGIDGNVYAIAQGNLVVGGFDASGADGSRITVKMCIRDRLSTSDDGKAKLATTATSAALKVPIRYISRIGRIWVCWPC